MEAKEEKRSRNFLEEIIDADLAEGRCQQVITRFPPEPNGYLHIGHAKAICLNFGLAEQYAGKCNLRYDDTNPAKEDEEYVRSIEEDIRWLGFSWDQKCYASDYFAFMFDCAVGLIQKGLAFVCDLSAEEIREYRGTLTTPGKESPFRNRSIEENLQLFYAMRDGAFADGEKVLRAKIDMASPNINMRDPVIYRIARAAHHRTGEQWIVYPMYDFAHPLEDAYEGITHSICTMEFEDHRPLYDWVIQHCDLKSQPHQYEFARLNLTQTIMSKRYLKKLVEDGLVSGWDDPRMPTISGIRRRGYTPASIRDFCNRIGVAKANSEVDLRLLEHCIREELNATAPRRMVVLKPVKLVITNYPEGKKEMLPAEDLPGGETSHLVPFGRELYIEQEDFLEQAPNKKYFRLAIGKEVRLKNAYIICCHSVEKDAQGNIVQINCTYDPLSKSGDVNAGKKVKGTLHWVEAETAVPATVRLYDALLLPEEENGEKDFSKRLNPNSLETLSALAEPELLKGKSGDRFQFMRQGYFCIDAKESRPDALVLNRIVGLKDSFAKILK